MTIARSIPAEFHLLGAPVVLAAASTSASAPIDSGKPRPFHMVAYTGGEVDLGFFGRAIFDLVGMDTPGDQVMPILRQHDGRLIAGQSKAIAKNASLEVDGELYPSTASGRGGGG